MSRAWLIVGVHLTNRQFIANSGHRLLPENGGISNLLLYALDLKLDGTNGSPDTLTGNVLGFTKRNEAVANGDVTYVIETSADLGVNDPWVPATSGVVETTKSISYTLPTESGGKLFARLKVTQTP